MRLKIPSAEVVKIIIEKHNLPFPEEWEVKEKSIYVNGERVIELKLINKDETEICLDLEEIHLMLKEYYKLQSYHTCCIYNKSQKEFVIR